MVSLSLTPVRISCLVSKSWDGDDYYDCVFFTPAGDPVEARLHKQFVLIDKLTDGVMVGIALGHLVYDYSAPYCDECTDVCLIGDINSKRFSSREIRIIKVSSDSVDEVEKV